MKQLSLLDKLKVVVDLTSSDKTYIIVICLLAFLSILFATTNRKNAKESKKTYGKFTAYIGAGLWNYSYNFLNCDHYKISCIIIYYV